MQSQLCCFSFRFERYIRNINLKIFHVIHICTHIGDLFCFTVKKKDKNVSQNIEIVCLRKVGLKESKRENDYIFTHIK